MSFNITRNATKLKKLVVGTSTTVPADGDLHVDGNVGVGVVPSDNLHVAGNSAARNTIVSNVTLDGGTSAANPYEGFGFGVNFIGRDYGDAVRNYAGIYTLMEAKTSSSGGGDAGFKTGLSFYTNSGGASGTNPTEKLRISSAGLATFSSGIAVTTGDVLIGTTNDSVATQSTDLGAVVSEAGRIYTTISDHHDLNRTADGETIRFRKSHVQCGSISVSAGATAFNTSSDYRLKENLTELTGALDRLDSIPVYNFNFKADPTRTVDGFLAHEVAEFVPESINGTKDEMETVVVTKAVEAVEAVAATLYAEGDELPDGVAVGDEKTPAVEAVEAVAEVTEEQPKYQGIDQSKLVPLMLAAIKELKAKVTALENA